MLPVHIFGYPADLAGAARATACRSSRTPARRSARSSPTARRSARPRPPAVFGFYPNKQIDDRRGRNGRRGRPGQKIRIDSERNQGRAPDMGWLDHDRLGFNYRLSDVAAAIGLAQLEQLDDMLARPRPRRRLVPRGARRARRRDAAVRRPRRREARLVRLRRPAPARRRSRRDDSCAARAGRRQQAVHAGDPPHELLPREVRLPPGEFPVARTSPRARSRCRSSLA